MQTCSHLYLVSLWLAVLYRSTPLFCLPLAVFCLPLAVFCLPLAVAVFCLPLAVFCLPLAVFCLTLAVFCLPPADQTYTDTVSCTEWVDCPGRP